MHVLLQNLSTMNTLDLILIYDFCQGPPHAYKHLHITFVMI